jgi:hypothetical protein
MDIEQSWFVFMFSLLNGNLTLLRTGSRNSLDSRSGSSARSGSSSRKNSDASRSSKSSSDHVKKIQKSLAATSAVAGQKSMAHATLKQWSSKPVRTPVAANVKGQHFEVQSGNPDAGTPRYSKFSGPPASSVPAVIRHDKDDVGNQSAGEEDGEDSRGLTVGGFTCYPDAKSEDSSDKLRASARQVSNTCVLCS